MVSCAVYKVRNFGSKIVIGLCAMHMYVMLLELCPALFVISCYFGVHYTLHYNPH